MAVGVVQELGPDTPGPAVGTRVGFVGGASYAEHTLVAAQRLVPLPDEVGDEVAGGYLLRSEERRVGQECVSSCSSRWSTHHYKQTSHSPYITAPLLSHNSPLLSNTFYIPPITALIRSLAR